MKCPACQRPLTELSIAGISLDVCHGGCGGIWFDKDELDTLNETADPEEEFLLRIPVDSSIEIDSDAARVCPRCGDCNLHQESIGGEDEGVVIDTCKKCGGTWLDHGELEWIQAH